jgi:hypothetical protein
MQNKTTAKKEELLEVLAIKEPWRYIHLKLTLKRNDGTINESVEQKLNSYEELYEIFDRKPFISPSHCCGKSAIYFVLHSQSTNLIYLLCEKCGYNDLPASNLHLYKFAKCTSAIDYITRCINNNQIKSPYHKNKTNSYAIKGKLKYNAFMRSLAYHKGLKTPLNAKKILMFFGAK